MTTTSYLTMVEKTDNTTELSATEYNEVKDGLTDGTKAIKTQAVQVLSADYSSSAALAIGGFANMISSSGTMAMTLADPDVAGLSQTITMGTGSNTVTVTCETAAGFGSGDTLTFTSVNNTIILQSISATKWIVWANSGVTIS